MGRTLHRMQRLFPIVLIILLFSLSALAEDRGAALDSLHFDIALQEDGSARITETREIVFNGEREYTRYGVNNAVTGPRVFRDWQVLLDETPLSQLDEPDNESRPENSFAVEDGDGQNTVYIYFRQQGSGRRRFQISYLVENAVKLYSDVGEYFWNLTEESVISDIGTLTATLTAPAGVPEEEFRIWAHGPLNGTFEKQGDGSAALLVEDVPLGTIVDLRATLPADCFTGGWVQQGAALDRILAEEKQLTDSANARREEEARAQAEREARMEAYHAEQEAYWAGRNAWAAEHPMLASIQNFCESLCDFFYDYVADAPLKAVAILGAGLFVLAAFWGRLRRNPKKFRHTPAQSPRYCRNLPDDRPAPAVDRLVHFYDGKADVSREIPATLLELNLHGLVYFRMPDGDVELLLNGPLGEELFPSPAPQDSEAQDMNRARIPEHQEILWNFLLDAAGGSDRISMKALNQYVRDNPEAAWHFRSSFERAVSGEFGERVKIQRVKRPPFGRNRLALLLPVAAGLLVMLICMLRSLYDGVELYASLWIGVIAFALAAVLLVLCCLGRRLGQGKCEILDQQAEDDLALWQAFGRYLEDFATLEDVQAPESSVWRKYMVYAVAMGHGQELVEALRLKHPESTSTGAPADEDEVHRLLREMELYRAMDSIGWELAEARQPVSPASGSGSSPSDNWSDSSGAGGGFSDSGGGSDSGSGGDFID